MINRITYIVVKTVAGIKDQCCNCHANLSPAGRIIQGTTTMVQNTKAEMPRILRMVTDLDLWDTFIHSSLTN